MGATKKTDSDGHAPRAGGDASSGSPREDRPHPMAVLVVGAFLATVATMVWFGLTASAEVHWRGSHSSDRRMIQGVLAPRAEAWAAAGDSMPGPREVKICRPLVRFNLFAPHKNSVACENAMVHRPCARFSIQKTSVGKLCAMGALAVARDLIERGRPAAAWEWYREAGTALALGLVRDPQGAEWISSAAVLEHISQGAVEGFPWTPMLGPWIRSIEGREDPELRRLRKRLGENPGGEGRRMILSSADHFLVDRVGSWRLAAALLRHLEGEATEPENPHQCGRIRSILWTEVCEPSRRPSYLAAQKDRLDSLVRDWGRRVPQRFPDGVTISGTEQRWHTLILDRHKAVGLATWRPRRIVIDTHEEDVLMIASILAHELGHHTDFATRGFWRAWRDSKDNVEWVADSIGGHVICESARVKVACQLFVHKREIW